MEAERVGQIATAVEEYQKGVRHAVVYMKVPPPAPPPRQTRRHPPPPGMVT
jgi:hypothetical protein